MNQVELKAAEILLDVGVAIPVRPLGFLRRKKKPRRVVMYTPCYGSKMRIDRKYMKMGVKFDEVKEYTFEQNIEFVVTHGKLLSEMVALTLVRGYFAGLLFCKPVAWWLRWRVHPAFLQEAWFQMLTMLNTKDFQTIISSEEATNLMKPRLSQMMKGS